MKDEVEITRDDQPYDCLGYQLSGGRALTPSDKLIGAWLQPERSGVDGRLRQAARAIGLSHVNCGHDQELHNFFASVIREYNPKNDPLQNVMGESEFRFRFSGQPMKLWDPNHFHQRRVTSVYSIVVRNRVPVSVISKGSCTHVGRHTAVGTKVSRANDGG